MEQKPKSLKQRFFDRCQQLGKAWSTAGPIKDRMKKKPNSAAVSLGKLRWLDVSQSARTSHATAAGKASAAKRTPEQRIALAQKAGRASAAKRKKA